MTRLRPFRACLQYMYSFSKHARSFFLKKTDHKKRKPRPQADGAFPPYYNLRGATPLERSRTGRKTCKPNFVECDHSSRRRVTADVQQRPTRRFQPLHGAALRRRADAGHTHCSERVPPSLFGLAPCGVYPAFGVAVEAVRSYRTFSPLPRGLAVQACALSVRPLAARNPKIALGRGGIFSVALAIHEPSQARVPDVIRHTALRSSDFPPPNPRLAPRLRQRSPSLPARV